MVSKSNFSLVVLVALGLVSGGNQMMAAAEPIGEPEEQIAAVNAENQIPSNWPASADIQKIALEWDGSNIDNIMFSPDRKWAMITTDVQPCFVYDVNTGKMVTKLAAGDDINIEGVFSPDSKYLATGSTRGTVTIWDVARWNSPVHIPCHTGCVNCIDFNCDSTFLVTASDDGTACIINVQTREYTVLAEKQGIGIKYAYFSFDGKHFVTVTRGGDAFVRDTSTKSREFYLNYFGGIYEGFDKINFAKFNPRDNSIFIFTSSYEGRIFDLPALSHTILGQLHLLGPVFSKNGEFIAGLMNNSVRLWDAHNGELLREIPYNYSDWNLVGIDFSPHGNRLLIYNHGDDKSVKIFDSHTGALINSANGLYGPVFSKHGSKVIGLSFDENEKPIFVKWTIGHDLAKPANS